MAPQKYQDYLAAQILSEGQIISYRALSRALKVHCNVAKEMLYDFHRVQNARRAGAIHATYLLTGQRKPAEHNRKNGAYSQSDDTNMANSSFMSSSMPEQDVFVEKLPVTSITLVSEEEVEAIKQLYEDISSIHIYSLEPGPLNNIHVLSDCNRKIAVEYGTEDPLESWKQYGTIHNPLTQRRTGVRPLPPTSAGPVPLTTAVKAIPKQLERDTTPQVQAQQSESRKNSAPDTLAAEQNTKKPASKTASLKRDNSSIFKSFAKTKAALPKDNSVSDASGAPSPVSGAGGDSHAEDEVMKDAPASDEEFEFDGDFALSSNSADSAQKAEAMRKARKDREAALRSMMDNDEDETMDDPPAPEEGTSTHSPPLEPTPDGQSLQPQQIGAVDTDADAEPQAATSNGRRRGRRKVMKKKTTRDAEGYLVTREEAAWESFSEDEPEPQKKEAGPLAKKVKGPVPEPDKGSKPLAKKGKPGQGNIMNFFAKK